MKRSIQSLILLLTGIAVAGFSSDLFAGCGPHRGYGHGGPRVYKHRDHAPAPKDFRHGHDYHLFMMLKHRPGFAAQHPELAAELNARFTKHVKPDELITIKGGIAGAPADAAATPQQGAGQAIPPQAAPQQPGTPQQPAIPQQEIAPQQSLAPQQAVAPQQPVTQQTVAPEQNTAPQQTTAPQQNVAPQQVTTAAPVATLTPVAVSSGQEANAAPQQPVPPQAQPATP